MSRVPLLVLVLALLPTLATADITVLDPVADNTLFETDGPTELSNGAGDWIFSGRIENRGGGFLRRAVLKFDIASVIPAGAQIEAASLSMTMTKTISGAQTTTLHRLSTDWGEAGSDATGAEGTGADAGERVRNGVLYEHSDLLRFPRRTGIARVSCHHEGVRLLPAVGPGSSTPGSPARDLHAEGTRRQRGGDLVQRLTCHEPSIAQMHRLRPRLPTGRSPDV